MSGALKQIDPDKLDATLPDGHWQVDTRELVRSGDRMRLQLCEMEPGGGAEPHVHNDKDQIFFVTDGALRVLDESGADSLVTAGQAILIPAGASHGTESASGGTTVYLVITYPSERQSTAA
jgi:mannose-6-phosphate isomerase-like protein (cupin superfamily)